MGGDPVRPCWCGHASAERFSSEYDVCRACGTLVSNSPFSDKIYEKDYWTDRQTEHHGLPNIVERSRLDLPERCTQWLRRLLTLRLPPGRILEIGCAHGAYVALLGWSGFDAIGTEMSPWVAHFAEDTFGVRVLTGEVEDQKLEPGTFDVIILNDVIEHLPDPAATLEHCSRLLTPNGFFLIQTPEYKEHLSYRDLKDTDDLFLKHMEGNNEEHLFLFSRRAVGLLFSRLGFSWLDFSNPVYSYDMFFAASRAPISVVNESKSSQALLSNPIGRLVQALLDKAYESNDRWWAMRRLEDNRK